MACQSLLIPFLALLYGVGLILVTPIFVLGAYLTSRRWNGLLKSRDNRSGSVEREECRGKGRWFEGKVIGFFHPGCFAGGGGERVLWEMVSTLQKKCRCVVFSGEKVSVDRVVEDIMTQFGISLSTTNLRIRPVSFPTLPSPHHHPTFTILGQMLSSTLLALSILPEHIDMFIDTQGFPFTYPLVKVVKNVPVVAYVHYPVVRVGGGVGMGGSGGGEKRGKRGREWEWGWWYYYKVVGEYYKMTGRSVDVAMVNSTWTQHHINRTWNLHPPHRTLLLHPPVSTHIFSHPPLPNRHRIILSLGQYRPEKNHLLQLQAFAHAHRTGLPLDVQMVMVGSCRGREDEERAREVERVVGELGLEDRVRVERNVEFGRVREWLARSLVGIHTMREEHFGIGVVELMASGLITIAHNSGGPKQDIITHPGLNGFLAETPSQYASTLVRIFRDMSPETVLKVQKAGRERAAVFSCERFREMALEGVLRVWG